ncbi:hypothetical protein OTU49_001468 [Cherax quadricarinatus]|uniref:Uncharacterized protein n=1 Tax=Cherax quadricarinatus TaxID=27406 RepID=A0AAW0XGL4_CHEQU
MQHRESSTLPTLLTGMTYTLPVSQLYNKLYKIQVKVVQVVPGKAADTVKFYDGSGECSIMEGDSETSCGSSCVVSLAAAGRPRTYCCLHLATELERCHSLVCGVLLWDSGHILVLQNKEHLNQPSTGPASY